MRFWLVICVSVLASACANNAVVLPPTTNPVIEDMGWKARTAVKPDGAPDDAKAATAKPQGTPSRPVRSASRPAASRAMVGASRETTPPSAPQPRTCGSTPKAECSGACTWVEVRAAGKAADQGYCTSARSF